MNLKRWSLLLLWCLIRMTIIMSSSTIPQPCGHAHSTSPKWRRRKCARTRLPTYTRTDGSWFNQTYTRTHRAWQHTVCGMTKLLPACSIMSGCLQGWVLLSTTLPRTWHSRLVCRFTPPSTGGCTWQRRREDGADCLHCVTSAVMVRERPEVDSVSVEFTVPMTLAVTTHSII